MAGVPLYEKVKNQYPNHFYRLEFRSIIESMLPYLKNHADTAKLSVEPDLVYYYNQNFYSLLFRLNQHSKYHYMIMRCSGIEKPTDDFSDLTSIYVPSPDLIARLTSSFKTTGTLKM